MTIYVFGNPDVSGDKIAFEVATHLNHIPDLEIIYVKPNEDLPFINDMHPIILDTVQGINKVTLIDETHLDKLIVSRSSTVHDFDLGFQLKYLKKLGKLNKFTIIGLPQTGDIDYDLIHSILRKLVVHDIQGS
jgi:hypothetical protein